MTLRLRPIVSTERYVDGGWEDISVYVVSAIDLDIGMMSHRYTDRLAKIGIFKFTVNNISHIFSDEESFPRNMPIRITVDAGDVITKQYICYIASISPPFGTQGERFIQITATDWFGIANKAFIRALTIGKNKRIDEAIPLLLAEQAVVPTSTSLETGDQTFGIVFDQVKTFKSTVYGEIAHLVMSEQAYCYLADDDTLVVEAFSHRNGLVEFTPFNVLLTIPADTYIQNADETEFLAACDGRYLIMNGTEEVQYNGQFDHFVGDSVLTNGKNVINDSAARFFERTVDENASSIAAFGSVNDVNEGTLVGMPIPPGKSLKIKGRYGADVYDADALPAYSVITPIILDEPAIGISSVVFNTAADGTGSSLKTSFSISFVGGVDGWEWTFTNNGTVLGYMTWYRITGKLLYSRNSISLFEEDGDSQEAYTKVTEDVPQWYSQDMEFFQHVLENLVDDEKYPRSVLEYVEMQANISQEEMLNFMLTDVGSLRNIVTTRPAINSWYWVQGIKATIEQNGLIKYGMRIREHQAIGAGLKPIALHLQGTASSKNIVRYRDPRLDDMVTMTISLWVYIGTSIKAVPLLSKFDNTAGWELWILQGGSVNGRIQLDAKFTGALGIWQTPLNTMVGLEDEWHHIAVTYNSNSSGNDPLIYVDGVSQTITEDTTPSGTFISDARRTLNIANREYSGVDRIYDFRGYLKDIRIYNTVLTPAQIVQLAGEENVYNNLTSNLLFQFPAVRRERYNWLIDQPLANWKLVENVSGNRGTVDYATVTNGEMLGADPETVTY